MICFHAIAQNTTEEYKKNDSFLPWSQEQKAETVRKKKEAQVSNIKSEYYSRMPEAAAKTLKECLDNVRASRKTQDLKYDDSERKLLTLTVPVTQRNAPLSASSFSPVLRAAMEQPPFSSLFVPAVVSPPVRRTDPRGHYTSMTSSAKWMKRKLKLTAEVAKLRKACADKDTTIDSLRRQIKAKTVVEHTLEVLNELVL